MNLSSKNSQVENPARFSARDIPLASFSLIGGEIQKVEVESETQSKKLDFREYGGPILARLSPVPRAQMEVTRGHLARLQSYLYPWRFSPLHPTPNESIEATLAPPLADERRGPSL